jgi:hypothetical protein
MSNSKSTSSGVGFTGLLTIVFIVLKLTNYIDWSWWWVLSPIWISLLFGLFILFIVFLIIFLRTKL